MAGENNESNGLSVGRNADGSIIRNLVFNGFNTALFLFGNNNLVVGCHIGVLAEEGAAVVVNYSSSREGADRVVADIVKLADQVVIDS